MKPIYKLLFAILAILLWLCDFILIPGKILLMPLPEGAEILPTLKRSMKHHFTITLKELNDALNKI